MRHTVRPWRDSVPWGRAAPPSPPTNHRHHQPSSLPRLFARRSRHHRRALRAQILSEDKDAHKDSSFTAMVEEKMDDLLSWSDDDDKYEFTVYKQDDCDYTWHHIAINEGDRRYLAVQEGSA